MKKLFIIVKIGYTSIFACNKVFESREDAKEFLASYCDRSKYEVSELNYQPDSQANRKAKLLKVAKHLIDSDQLVGLFTI